MYLNIGGDFSVRAESVIGVFDLDNTSCSKWTRKFLAEAQKAGAVVEATDELPKSFLVVSEYGENRVILTKYNAAVLLKRMQDAQRTPISAKGEAILQKKSRISSKLKKNITPAKSRFWRDWRPSESGPACISARPAVRACTIWSMRSSITQSTKHWPDTASTSL